MTEAQAPGLPDGVSMTALGVAWVRALESARPDRLFEDQLAAGFLDAAGWRPPDLPEPAPDDTGADETARAMVVLAQSVIVRTRFLDELLAGAWAAGARQVVTLGAGLDTRAYRLPWPDDGACFELDLAPVLEFKERALARSGAVPRCRRILVPCDLLADWPTALLEAGFSRQTPTVWIAEGLLIYFNQAENDRLLEEIGVLSTVGDRLAVTFSQSAGAAPASRAPGMVPAGLDLLLDPGAVIDLWRWEPPGDLAGWFAAHGWAAHLFDRDALARDYGRPLAWAEQADAATRTILIDAQRL